MQKTAPPATQVVWSDFSLPSHDTVAKSRLLTGLLLLVEFLFTSIQWFLLAAGSLTDGLRIIVANMFNKLSGQPESYEKKYAPPNPNPLPK